MLWQPSLSAKYQEMSADDLAAAITARRKELAGDLLILGHHYQQDEVIQHADLTGDSLKLSQMAAEEAVKRGTKYIIFCGVHFMAETADMLTPDEVQVILPDLSAGCSMADMAEYDDLVTAWEELHKALERLEGATDRARDTKRKSSKSSSFRASKPRVIPITYVNSTAAVKAFVGDHGGACCTSSNAMHIFSWAMAGGTQPQSPDEDIKLLFLPDQHLGRNTAKKFGLFTDVDAQQHTNGKMPETALWDFREECGGLTDEQIRDAKVLLWAGHCSVHKLFRPEHVDHLRGEFADRGGVHVLVHPECMQEVVDKADFVGSTEYIINSIRTAKPKTNWAVGTEVHLVNRLADEAAKRDVHVRMLSECQCLCTTMFRIDQQHLLWSLDELAAGRVVNRVRVPKKVRQSALLALDRMLANVAPSGSASGRATASAARGASKSGGAKGVASATVASIDELPAPQFVD